MPDKPEVNITGQSQITVNKKIVAIVVAAVLLFVGGIGWMYQITATARPVTTQSGGY